jgi:FkbM family methyltransferase
MFIVNTPNGKFMCDPEDIYISSHMSSGQVFEGHIINGTLLPIIRTCKYIVDVGANIGCHSVSYANANQDCSVWAFEPQKKLFNILETNVMANNLGDRVKTYNFGLGHKEMNTQLNSLDKVYDSNRDGHNKGGLGIGEGGEIMELKTLDSMNLPGLDFLKIDVEGAEGLVLQGAAETIKKYKPTIFFEHNSQTIDPKLVGVGHVPTPFEVLVQLGYRTFKYIDWENYITSPN